MSLTADEITNIYYAIPEVLRKHSHWVMSQETFNRILHLPGIRTGSPVAKFARLLDKRIEIDPEAIGVTLVPECICDLEDVSTFSGPKFVRGFSRGCALHPPTEYELRVLAEQEKERAAVEAAMRAAREAP